MSKIDLERKPYFPMRHGLSDIRKAWLEIKSKIDELCQKIVENPGKYSAYIVQDELPYLVPVCRILEIAEQNFRGKTTDEIRIGDVVAYRSLDDNDFEWRSFTVRHIEGGYLYEREDKSGDNIAVEFAHKVQVRY